MYDYIFLMNSLFLQPETQPSWAPLANLHNNIDHGEIRGKRGAKVLPNRLNS